MFVSFHFFTQWKLFTTHLFASTSTLNLLFYPILHLEIKQSYISYIIQSPLHPFTRLSSNMFHVFLLKMLKVITANNFCYYFQLERKKIIVNSGGLNHKKQCKRTHVLILRVLICHYFVTFSCSFWTETGHSGQPDLIAYLWSSDLSLTMALQCLLVIAWIKMRC